MSQSGKLITKVTIELSDELKAALDDTRKDAAQTRAAVELWQRQAERESAKRRGAGGLLAAMAAANDAPQSEFKQLGQWVFEGQDKKWVSAATNTTGQAYLHNIPKKNMRFDHRTGWWHPNSKQDHEIKHIDGDFDPSGFAVCFVSRQPVNDVDYLTDSDSEHDIAPTHEPELRGMAATLAVADDMQSLSKNDLQRVFIKNMADVLIQRMHSLDRFSDDDYYIDGDKLVAWDIVIFDNLNIFGVIFGAGDEDRPASLLFLPNNGDVVAAEWDVKSYDFSVLRTIADTEISKFKSALETCYDN